MGGGVSVENGTESFRFKRSDTATLRSKRECSTRGNIQQKRMSYAQYQAMYNTLLRSESVEVVDSYETVTRLLSDAIQRVTAEGHSIISDLDIGLLARVLKSECYEANEYLYKEGDDINKLFVLENGEIEASAADLSSRTINSGQLIGEQSLFFSLPSTESYQCVSDCTLYSVERSVFLMIRKMTSTASLLQTSEWLQSCPELQRISPSEMTTLLGLMKPVSVKSGEVLYEGGSPMDSIFLVRKGMLQVVPSAFLSSEAGTEKDDNKHQHPKWVDSLGVVYPRSRDRGVESMTVEEFITKYIRRHQGPQGEDFSPDSLPELQQSHQYQSEYFSGESRVILDAGCLFGWPALTVRGNMASEGIWKWNPASGSPRKNKDIGRVTCPVTVTAQEDSVCLMCKVSVIEHFMLDAARRVAREQGFNGTITECRSVEESLFKRAESSASPRPRTANSAADAEVEVTAFSIPGEPVTDQAKALPKMDGTHMENLGDLGEGAFGMVVKARYTDDGATYALKYIAKEKLRENDKKVAFYDAEKEMLASFDCDFVLRLFGSFETENAIVLVTELLDRGDLWGAIYDNPVYDEAGLPPDMVRFYMCCLVLALDHVHSHSVVFRDLKPENVMIDSRGVLRLIDFGLAKKVPFIEETGNGEFRVMYRTFTVCGTFEYLAPELITGEGVDRSADLWALGAVMHEMYMLRTPFVNEEDPDDMQSLFASITLVKHTGCLDLNRVIDEKDGTRFARDLMMKLMQGEREARIGYQEQSTRRVLDHPFFNTLDIAAVENHTYVPSYIPLCD